MQRSLAIRGANSTKPLTRRLALTRLSTALLLAVTALLGAAAPAHALDITFADPNLEAAVRSTIGVAQPLPVTDTDMLRLTTLNAYNSSISSLGGLEYAANLASLGLPNNQISDLSPLSGLRKLVSLDVQANGASDLSPLAGVTSLQTLYANRNGVSDLAPLSGLTALRYLYVQNNQVSSIAGLSGLLQLSELDISGNLVTDLTSLSPLVKLTYLRASNNRLVTLQGLENHPLLYLVWVESNQLTDLSPLSSCPSLGSIAAGHNGLTDVSPLSGLSRLYWLWCSDNRISDISGLQGLTALQNLNLENNRVSDLSVLAGLTGLTNLNLKSNKLTSIAALSGLPNLQYIWLGGNHVSDVAPLASCPRLTFVAINQNWVSDISPLFAITQLAHLDVQMNYLDVSTGSPTMNWIAALQAAGASVSYTNQGVIPQTVIAPLPSSPDGTNGWYVTLPTVALSSYSPAWTTWTRYVLDGAPETTYTARIAIQEGVHTVSAYSFDSQQMTGPTNTKTFYVDTVAPSAPVLSSSAVGTSTVSLTWAASMDEGSGVAGYTLFTGDGSVVATTGATGIDLSGLAPDTAYDYYVTTTDVAGNTSAASNVLTVRTDALDTTAPVTTISGGPFSMWTAPAPVTFELSAVDEGGSGIAATYYSLDGGDPQLFPGGGVSIAVDGTTSVSYWSVDNAGNAEVPKSASVQIDTIGPDLLIGAETTYTVTATLTAEAFDAMSGLARVEMKLDSGEWVSATSLTTSVIGAHTVYARAFDAVGNMSEESASFTVVSAPPAGETLPTCTKLRAACSMKVGHRLMLWGVVRPKSGPMCVGAPSGSVELTMERRVGDSWVSEGVATLTLDRGRYRYSFVPQTAGEWRFVASYSGGQSGATTFEPSVSKTVGVEVHPKCGRGHDRDEWDDHGCDWDSDWWWWDD